MECLAISKLPDGSDWSYEIKLDGYRAEAVRSSNGVAFYSRNGKSLNKKFPYVVEALRDLPPDTVVDGELVALDDSGRPEFNLKLQGPEQLGGLRRTSAMKCDEREPNRKDRGKDRQRNQTLPN
jgi:hypothetical protein